jgi:hypothetical protein
VPRELEAHMKTPIVVLAALTLSFAIATAHLANELRAERSRTQFEAVQRRGLQARLDALERDRAKSTASAGRSGSIAAEPSPSRPPPSDTRSAAQPATNARSTDGYQQRWFRAQDEMLKDPEGRELLYIRRRSELLLSNSDLFQHLQLTPTQTDRLADLLAEHSLQQSDVVVGQQVTRSAGFATLNDLRTAQRRDIAALLGEDKAQQFERYEASRPIRQQVRQLRAQLSATEGMSDDQAERLIAVLQEERERFNTAANREQANGKSAVYHNFLGGGTFVAIKDRGSTEEQFVSQMESYDHALRQRAANILTSQQLAKFATLQERQTAIARADLRSRTVEERIK